MTAEGRSGKYNPSALPTSGAMKRAKESGFRPPEKTVEPSLLSETHNTSTPDQQHFHRWRIDEPNGEKSVGRCKCGAHKDFKNYLSEGDFITNEEHRAMNPEFDY